MAPDKNSGPTSLLSKKVKIEGEILGDEDLRVEGHFKGTIKVVGDIHVGQSGVVLADIEAENVVVEGQVTGNVLARKQLEIQSSGQLLGDCRAKSIDIREGAIFEGRSSMLRSGATPSGSDPGTSADAKTNPS
ncbi:MAG: polymer-forming cytoskeletal protein [Desulfobacterales bacterium]|jgi:cytoskeletal protein CcmA (bactofilin family)